MSEPKYKVGQKVFMVSGGYFIDGKIIKITPSGVEVRISHPNMVFGPWDPILRKHTRSNVWRFDTKGEACDGCGTADGGPWVIDDLPFTERKTLLKQEEARRPRNTDWLSGGAKERYWLR